MSERLKPFLAGVCTTLTVIGLVWLVRSLLPSEGSRQNTSVGVAPSLSPTASPTPSVPLVVATPPSSYRLAGVAENAGQLFAVVESPKGEHGLYRKGDEVPGLGRLVSIADERATFDTPGGRVTLWVAPAPTATRTITPRRTPATPARSPLHSPPSAPAP